MQAVALVPVKCDVLLPTNGSHIGYAYQEDNFIDEIECCQTQWHYGFNGKGH
jgi:hypothetical protein